MTRRADPAACALLLLLASCSGRQSALVPFGEDARSIRDMTVVLSAGALAIIVVVAALIVIAIRARPGQLDHVGGSRLILWGGAVVPALVLGALLLWALPTMRPRAAAPGDLRIAVQGEQFWWRMTYRPAGLPPLDDANELRLPAGRTVVLDVTAQDVVHSLWVPGLAGKMDMIPGRTNRLVVRASKPGRYRGQCAEFCGLSHALMAFDVVVMEPRAFDAWLAAARRPPPGGGEDAGFLRHGCGGCHTIRGTQATGRIGPDLSRFGAHGSAAAGTLPVTEEAVARFIRTPSAIKPGARMPAFETLTRAEARAIARYLMSLQ